tara:strand:+ start:61317 stop:62603 length:1287 start_codon:yes stop_codon:yes gene_type:complete
MGILDNKSRVLDTVITGEGRRQLAMGNFNPAFATVSDRHTYYEKSEVSGTVDASDRIYFEASPDNMTDYITFETDDSGRLLGYPIHEGHYWEGRVGTVEAFGVGELGEPKYKTVGIEGFASQAVAMITSSIENFKDLQTIGTRDATEVISLKTRLSDYSYNFLIDNNYPFAEGSSNSIVDLDSMETLFFDDRVSDSINFKFLPPIVKDHVAISLYGLITGFTYGVTVPLLDKVALEALGFNLSRSSTDPITAKTMDLDFNAISSHSYPILEAISLLNPTPIDLTRTGYRYLGNYTDIRTRLGESDSVDYYDTLTFDKLMAHLDYSHKVTAEDDLIGGGLEATYTELNTWPGTSRESIEINFETTSTTNNIVMQMFEVVPELGILVKLDTIQFSDFSMEKERDIFFAGKLLFNNSGMPVYGNLFDIVVD